MSENNPSQIKKLFDFFSDFPTIVWKYILAKIE